MLRRGYYARILPSRRLSTYYSGGSFSLTNSILMEMYVCAISIADVDICLKIWAYGCGNCYKYSKNNSFVSIYIWFPLWCFYSMYARKMTDNLYNCGNWEKLLRCEASKINKKNKIDVIIVHDTFGFNVILAFHTFKWFYCCR